jgi:hypothetical protein
VFHEPLHKFIIYLCYGGDIACTIKLCMENTLQVWNVGLSTCGNSYEWKHLTMSIFEFRGYDCYVLSTIHGKFHLSHTHALKHCISSECY